MARTKMPPIQFTKGELQMIDKGIDQFFREWHNGYKSAGRVYVAGRIRDKVRSALSVLRSNDSKETL
jgi:hypothetical protein